MNRLASVGLGSVLSLCVLSWAANSEVASEFPQAPDAMSRCWQDLASDDAGKAYVASWQLAQNPAPALKLLRQHLSPAAAPNWEQIQTWLTELESPKFAVRDKAFKELEKQGELAEAALRKVLSGKPGLESRQRAELLLDRLQTNVRSPEKLRMIRAVEILEKLGTAEAKDLLGQLAKGFPEHRLTREAEESLKRLKLRSPTPDRWLAWAQSPPPAADKEDPLPFGARTRLGTTRFRQEGYGRSAQFSPDSRLVISDDDSAVYLWDIQTGKLLRKFKITSACMAVAPKGTLLALGLRASMQEDDAVVWWDWQAGKEVGRVTLPPKADPQQLAFSLDGNQLTCRENQSLRVWDTNSREEIKVWQAADARQKLCSVSADGNHVVIDSANGVLVLNLHTKTKLVLQGAQRRPSGVAFSPDGKSLTLRDGPGGRARIWDVATGKALWGLPEGSRAYGYTACFSADGKILAASGTEDVGLWESNTGKFLKSLPGFRRVDAISPDGRWLAAVRFNTVEVCNLLTGKTVETSEGHFDAINDLEFLPHFGLIATAQRRSELRFWDPVTGVQNLLIQLDLHWIRGLSFSADGHYVAVGRPGPGDGFVGVWETTNGRQIYKLPGRGVRHFGRFTIVGFSPDNRFLLSWGDDFYLRKWDLKTGRAVLEKRIVPTGREPPEDDENGRARGVLDEINDPDEDAAFTPQTDQFLLLRQGGLHCFDVATGKESRVLKIEDVNHFGTSLTVSPTGTHVATTAAARFGDGLQLKLIVRDLASGKTLFDISVPGNYGGGRFSPDGRTVAVGGGKKVVLVEVATGNIRLEIPAPSRRLAFSPDGRFLVTAMPDTTALVWDLAVLVSGSK
jgi:WD40 repeat protein